MMIESIREHDSVHMTDLRKQNFCLHLVVLLEIDDLVCKIGNVSVKLTVQRIHLLRRCLSSLVSAFGLRCFLVLLFFCDYKFTQGPQDPRTPGHFVCRVGKKL